MQNTQFIPKNMVLQQNSQFLQKIPQQFISNNQILQNNQNNFINPNQFNQNNQIQELELRFKQIVRHSSEFSKLEYLLRFSLNSLAVSIVRAFKIRTSQEINNFLQKGDSFIETWIDSKYLDEKNSKEQILEKGFVISENGLKVTVGNFSFDKNEKIEIKNDFKNEDELNEVTNLNLSNDLISAKETINDLKKEIKKESNSVINDENKENRKELFLLFCYVNLGKCYCTENVDGDVSIPEGYDSLYIQPENKFCHEFIIFDVNKVNMIFKFIF
jgi:hypothetical protein